jgi:hypothetical protein
MSEANGDKTNEQRIAKAYLSLPSAPIGEYGERMISLEQIGNLEIRLVDFAPEGNADSPLVWLELFDHDTKSTVDSCQCHTIEDAMARFADLVLQARGASE